MCQHQHALSRQPVIEIAFDAPKNQEGARTARGIYDDLFGDGQYDIAFQTMAAYGRLQMTRSDVIALALSAMRRMGGMSVGHMMADLYPNLRTV